jgi:replication factor A3
MLNYLMPHLAEMDTSAPSPFVNGETLKMFVGRRVRTVVQVQRNESGVLVVQSTDGHQLTIRGAPDAPEAPHYIEVIGIPDSNQSIRAESWTDFGENFGEI